MPNQPSFWDWDYCNDWKACHSSAKFGPALPRWSVLLMGLFFIIGITMGAYGTFLWSQVNNDNLTHKPSTCFVNSRISGQDICEKHTCVGAAKDRTCSTKIVVCWKATWSVTFTPENGAQAAQATVWSRAGYDSPNDAQAEESKYDVGQSYDCWYEPGNPTVARWEAPKLASPYLYVMICGWILCGGVVAFILVYFVFMGGSLQRKGYVPL